LIDAGCKKIAYLVVNKTLSIGKMRMQGYLDALKENKMPVVDDLIIDCSNEQKENIRILGKAYKLLQPDGVFASVERLAIASYYVSQELGISIPADMKVISFSSLEIASLLSPSLTTITQPAFKMGTKAAKLLFNTLEGEEDTSSKHLVLKSELIPRNSTQK